MAQRDDDARLAAEVMATLRRNTFLEPLAMQVDVDNGIVTLTGSVESDLARQTAEQEVRDIVGVQDVRNRLTLMGPESSSRSDDDIVSEVMKEISRDPTIENPERFHVRSRFGQVFVSGTAESYEEHESVLAAVHRVPGVESIDDRMEINIPIVGERGPGRG